MHIIHALEKLSTSHKSKRQRHNSDMISLHFPSPQTFIGHPHGICW
uniref:Uncharacterized protein n=1 Tax=Manihot esculenta TaxID=3983 RepID=A0A2C9VBX9_MANES